MTSNPVLLSLPSGNDSYLLATSAHNNGMKTCEVCMRSHSGGYGSGRFCSSSCARKVGACSKWSKLRKASDGQQREKPKTKPPISHRPASTPLKKSHRIISKEQTPSIKKPVSGFLSQSSDILSSSEMICEGCSNSHDGSYGSGRFCGPSCARRVAASMKWQRARGPNGFYDTPSSPLSYGSGDEAFHTPSCSDYNPMSPSGLSMLSSMTRSASNTSLADSVASFSSTASQYELDSANVLLSLSSATSPIPSSPVDLDVDESESISDYEPSHKPSWSRDSLSSSKYEFERCDIRYTDSSLRRVNSFVSSS